MTMQTLALSRIAKARLHRQAGLTLTETLMVIAIGAIAIIGGTMLYMQALGGSNVQRGFTQVQSLAANVQSVFNGQGSYNGLTDAFVISAGIAPPDMVNAAGTGLDGVFGGAVSVASINSDAQYRIRVANVPEDACIRLVTMMAGQGGAGLDSITAPNGAIDLDNVIASAQTQCDGGGQMDFIYD